jgi:hypothetical protein
MEQEPVKFEEGVNRVHGHMIIRSHRTFKKAFELDD